MYSYISIFCNARFVKGRPLFVFKSFLAMNRLQEGFVF